MALKLKSSLTFSNYNFSDLQKGYYSVLFYGGAATSSASTSYILGDHSFTSDPMSTGVLDINDGSYTLKQEQDFDIQFNLPRIVKGDLFLNFRATGNSDLYIDYAGVYFKIYVYHYNGVTETQLGLVQTVTSYYGYFRTTDKTYALTMAIASKLFKKGEIFRVNVQMWAKNLGTNPTADCSLVHDGTSDFKIWVPFRIDAG